MDLGGIFYNPAPSECPYTLFNISKIEDIVTGEIKSVVDTDISRLLNWNNQTAHLEIMDLSDDLNYRIYIDACNWLNCSNVTGLTSPLHAVELLVAPLDYF